MFRSPRCPGMSKPRRGATLTRCWRPLIWRDGLPKPCAAWICKRCSTRTPAGGRHRTDTIVQFQYRCSPAHCQACPLQAQCTSNPEVGRTITRGEHDDLIEAHKARMETAEAKALYRLRKQAVELVTADLKGHRKFRRFSGRGLACARTEVGLLVLTHNLLALTKASAAAKADATVSIIPEETAAGKRDDLFRGLKTWYFSPTQPDLGEYLCPQEGKELKFGKLLFESS